jgi:dUTPase
MKIEQMKVKVKLLSNKAVMPEFANPGDAGADLYAVSRR